MHALKQLIVCFQLERVPRQRVGTIAIRLLLPTVSLCVAFLAVNPVKVPALYWRGMDADDHSLYLQVSCSIGAWYLITALLGALYILLQVLRDPPRNTSKQLATSLHDLQSCISTYIGRSIKTLISLGIFLIILFATILPFSVLAYAAHAYYFPPAILFMSACYVVRAYLTLGPASAQSCFFMPCTPQSVLDSDQAFTLLGGLVTLFGG